MKRSIKKQIASMFIGLVAFILIAFLVIYGRFLEQYYVVNKQEELMTTYSAIDQGFKDNTLNTDPVFDKILQLTETGNISLLVVDDQDNAILRTNREDSGRLKEQLIGYLLDRNQTNGKLLKSNEFYEIRKLKDQINNSEYIEMFGKFSNGYSFIMRSPLDSIKESVAISNQFLLYVGIAIILLSFLFVWYISKRITDPILELATLSQKMATLDFDARYTSGGNNEIGILGRNFNVMSIELESTIKELKTANNELQKDIKQKEEVEAMRTEFLGNVSHELKTPIALIQGYAEGLKEGIDGDLESRQFYCDVIMDEANKMNQMVKSLLVLNQLESSSDPNVVERFDIVALIKGVIQSCDIMIQHKGVQIQFIQKSPIFVWADEFKTEQVVRNYIYNALNHVSSTMFIEITVEIKNDHAHIKVFNTGNIIPEEDIEHIWEKFYKVDKARTRAYGGNGIGLSIVKAIMESFCQEYGVENRENGVEFWFELETK